MEFSLPFNGVKPIRIFPLNKNYDKKNNNYHSKISINPFPNASTIYHEHSFHFIRMHILQQ